MNIRIMVLMVFVSGAAACSSAAKLQRPPSDPIASVDGRELYAKGIAYSRVGDLTRAEQYLNAALIKGHDRQKTVRALVKVCVVASRLRVAAEYARPYLLDEPQDAVLHYVVGTIHLALDQQPVALTHLKKALQARRPSIEAAFILGGIAMEEGRLEQAMQYFSMYLEGSTDGKFVQQARDLLRDLGAAKVAVVAPYSSRKTIPEAVPTEMEPGQ